VPRIRLHIHLSSDHSLGPGKVALLEAIEASGSISAAARDLGMAYRHAWELVDDMNRAFDSPIVRATSGGRAGGGARLTPLGRSVALRFRAMEAAALGAIAADLRALARELRGAGTPRASLARAARRR
jgi:molybdate transport system regulatory protein